MTKTNEERKNLIDDLLIVVKTIDEARTHFCCYNIPMLSEERRAYDKIEEIRDTVTGYIAKIRKTGVA
jgi:hypothetical protein